MQETGGEQVRHGKIEHPRGVIEVAQVGGDLHYKGSHVATCVGLSGSRSLNRIGGDNGFGSMIKQPGLKGGPTGAKFYQVEELELIAGEGSRTKSRQNLAAFVRWLKRAPTVDWDPEPVVNAQDPKGATSGRCEVEHKGKPVKTVVIDGEVNYCGRDLANIYTAQGAAAGNAVMRWRQRTRMGRKALLGPYTPVWVFTLAELESIASDGRGGHIKAGVFSFVKDMRKANDPKAPESPTTPNTPTRRNGATTWVDGEGKRVEIRRHADHWYARQADMLLLVQTLPRQVIPRVSEELKAMVWCAGFDNGLWVPAQYVSAWVDYVSARYAYTVSPHAEKVRASLVSHIRRMCDVRQEPSPLECHAKPVQAKPEEYTHQDPTPEPVEKQEPPPEVAKPVDVDRVKLLMWIAREASGDTKDKALAKLVEAV